MSQIGGMHIHKQHGNKSGLESIKPMLEEILASFPADSLVQYKTISKFWYDLICSPEFLSVQLRRSKKNMIYIIHEDGFSDVYLMDLTEEEGFINKITLSCFNEGFYLRLISSFNGLLCFTNEIESDDVDICYDIDICICNPITQKVLVLPRGSPSISDPTVGVAFDPDSGHYKVFRFFKDMPEPEDYKCEVYSSRTGLWKGIDSVESHPIDSYNNQANSGHICVGGTVYWFSRSKEDPSTPTGILSVDKEEKFKRISFPQGVVVDVFSSLIDLDGRISLVTAEFGEIKTYLNIWVLEDHEQSNWSHKIFTELQVHKVIEIDSVVSIDNEILFIVVDIDMDLHYHVYHLDRNVWDILYGIFPSVWDFPVALPFAASLCPCRGID